MKKPKVIVILGPTATGKSNLAVKLAKKLNGEIISADSRQVYKILDIGTGKITKKEMRGVPHHLLDVVNPKTKFSVIKYQTLANKALEQILKKGRTPIICGGTGFYIDAVTKGVVFPEVPPNNKLRKELEKKNPEDLIKILNKLDKARARNIDKKNKVRLIRAIEIAKYLGKVPKIKEKKNNYEFIKVGLTLPQEELKGKIGKRIKKMFKDGLLKEVSKLKRSGISEKRLKEFGFEYYKPTLENVITGNIKYAKRQMTWFKRDNEIKWFTLSSSEGFTPSQEKDIEKYISKKI
ncbi:MAG: tRNA dimethylallyltransferase [Patescibacteria group bacterium]|nr:tRNA dimethylallyltransferase [Patescibacteria group bacterium]